MIRRRAVRPPYAPKHRMGDLSPYFAALRALDYGRPDVAERHVLGILRQRGNRDRAEQAVRILRLTLDD